MKTISMFVTALAILTMLVVGCVVPATPGPTPQLQSPVPATGIIEVRVTDAPAGYEVTSIMVKVAEDGIQVHRASDNETEGIWITIPITGDNPFDLKELEDVEEKLGSDNMTAGRYTQIRMDIEWVKVTYLTDNETEITDNATMPSGKLKFVRPFEVVEGETTVLLLDFDAEKSVIFTGSDKIMVKPVVKLSIEQGGKEKPSELGYSLEATDNATAALSTEEVYRGSKSVHLETTGTEGTGNEARIVIPLTGLPGGTTLGDIESISWWVWTVAGYPPHVDIVMDVDEDTNLDDEDMLTAEMAYNNADGKELDEGLTPTTGEWLQTFELTPTDGYGETDNGTMLWVTKMGAGNDDAPWLTLAEWKAGDAPNDPGSDGLAAGVIDGNAPVLRLEIEIDNWVLQTEAYVDDIEIVIGGVTYTIDL